MLRRVQKHSSKRQLHTTHVGAVDGYATLMSLNKSETAVHGCHCPGDMAVPMREVLARPWVWVSECVPLALSLSCLFREF